MRTDVLHVGFDNVTMAEAVAEGLRLIGEPGFHYAVTPNPEIVWLAQRDPELMTILENASLVLPDGIGVLYGAKILGRPLKEKVGGADFAEALIAELAKQGGSVFLFGAKPGVAALAGEKLAAKYPGLVIAGAKDGYFTDDTPIIEAINAAKPDLLLVCLGAPKQEKWMALNGPKLDTRLAIGLGGSLDVYAGVVDRAPETWQKLNLEWLYRLKREPRRFWRMLRLPAFLVEVMAERAVGLVKRKGGKTQ